MAQSFHGKNSIIRIGAENGEVLAATRGLSLSISADTVDRTSRDDAEEGFTRHMASWKTATISCDGLFVAPSESQATLLNAFLAGDALPLTIEIAPGITYTASGIPTSFDVESDYEDVITFSTEFQVDGAVQFSGVNGAEATGTDMELKTGLDKIAKTK